MGIEPNPHYESLHTFAREEGVRFVLRDLQLELLHLLGVAGVPSRGSGACGAIWAADESRSQTALGLFIRRTGHSLSCFFKSVPPCREMDRHFVEKCFPHVVI